MKAKRSGAVVLTGAALFGLLGPGVAVARDGDVFSRTVSGGYASWATTATALTDHGVSLVAGEGARGSAHRTWFPAAGGGADPETGVADVEFDGTARLARSTDPDDQLVLGGLRLRLADGGGALYARTELDGERREIALADVEPGAAAPAVRDGGVTWTGLRAALTDEGARLLAAWSGREFAAGDALGLLDLTVGTGGGATPSPARPDTPAESPAPQPAPTATATPVGPDEGHHNRPTAAVAHRTLTAGGEQEVTGEGFAPGAVVLVAIDGDTRYQAVADERGRVGRTFPVYASAAEGEHAAELYTVTGEQGRAVARFDVRGVD
ncbi:HtaA domain-containing protein [Streptomyces spinoverrucosus]|uniref:HtaA domain-containing protein n=1 Tax=Streptomyces spinoverrucosus TaxID=284043 RepID=UPI0018C42328|nr:HtaA domain-containing protein [Streptomyces spinoverrucosus]MBG0857436.1 HtaA domain-containing protein [Streptomyces spinoverrucosus]